MYLRVPRVLKGTLRYFRLEFQVLTLQMISISQFHKGQNQDSSSFFTEKLPNSPLTHFTFWPTLIGPTKSSQKLRSEICSNHHPSPHKFFLHRKANFAIFHLSYAKSPYLDAERSKNAFYVFEISRNYENFSKKFFFENCHKI